MHTALASTSRLQQASTEAATPVFEQLAAVPALEQSPAKMMPVKASVEDVPRTLTGAMWTFLTHPTPVLVLASLALLLHWRLGSEFGAADALVAAGVVALWLFQEWALHRYLLHSSFAWFGRDIHVGHHSLKPYYHVSIDSPALVLSVMAASGAVAWAALGGSPLAGTAAAAYWSMGLGYEWTHFIVHTRYVPRSAFGKAVRRNHQQHHMHNEAYWLAFMLPSIDKWMGTCPVPRAVPRSDMAAASRMVQR